MTFEQIQTLMNYGFTVDQIMTLARDKPEETPQEETPQEETPPEENTPPPGNPETDTVISELRTEIENLKSSIQQNNIKTQTVETIPNSETTENILAGIIRPVYETKEEK